MRSMSFFVEQRRRGGDRCRFSPSNGVAGRDRYRFSSSNGVVAHDRSRFSSSNGVAGARSIPFLVEQRHGGVRSSDGRGGVRTITPACSRLGWRSAS
jgi:hypothetical protein